MTNAQRASIAPGRRILVALRGRQFYALVTERTGSVLTLDPEQPVRGKGAKGSRITTYSCNVADVQWAAPQWSPFDALKATA